MSGTVLMVGTRKGLWIGTSDDGARGLGVHRAAPRHGGGLLLHGRHPRRPAAAASPAPRPAGSGRRCGASDDLGETWQETPDGAIKFPEGADATVERVWQLVPGTEDGVGLRRHRARRGLALRRTAATTFALERALWDHPHRPEWGAGFGGQAFHTILPHPTDPDSVTAAHLHRRRLPDQRRRGLVGAAQPGHPGRVPARGPAVPRVRPVRAQGDPAPVPSRAAVPAEPRRRLPLRRPRRESWSYIADGLPADFGFPVVVHPHEPDTVFVFPISGGDGRYPPDAQGPGLALARRRRVVGGARQRAARRLLRRRDARRDVRRPPRPRPGSTSAPATARVWASADSGESWRQVVANLPDVMVVRAAAY